MVVRICGGLGSVRSRNGFQRVSGNGDEREW